MPAEPAAADRHLRLLLTPDPDAPAQARRALQALPLGPVRDDAILLCSELVTNAVRHAQLGEDELIEVDADRMPEGAWRIAVRDHGCGFQPGPPSDGFGLQVMAAATPDWGFDRVGGTCVWFELR
jgi:signal transduction histidine kinase